MTDKQFESILAQAMPNLKPQFYSKIAGITHRNPDGSDRAALIAAEPEFAVFELIPEPDNPIDPKAIAVQHPLSGAKLGYLPEQTAHDLLPQMEDDRTWVAILRCHNQTPEHKAAGANVLIAILK